MSNEFLVSYHKNLLKEKKKLVIKLIMEIFIELNDGIANDSKLNHLQRSILKLNKDEIKDVTEVFRKVLKEPDLTFNELHQRLFHTFLSVKNKG